MELIFGWGSCNAEFYDGIKGFFFSEFVLLPHSLYVYICSMEGGELFTSIQERADNAFTERGKDGEGKGIHYSFDNVAEDVGVYRI